VSPGPGPAAGYRCPICGAAVAVTEAACPFCSPRCRLVDLGRWFREDYVVPGEDAVALDRLAFPEAGPGAGDDRGA
jgi:endogenous inhibitor of DNA gyrase (YacG/DUF329 family)